MSLWRDPDDVPHCRILSPDKTEWWLISATHLNLNLRSSIIIKKILQDDRREEAQILYKSRYYKDKNQVFLKPANDLLAITSLLRLFHSFTILLLKEYFTISSLTLFFVTLMDDLLNWILIEQKNISSPMSS